MDSDFYLDVYSNSSMDIYPNNTLSSFRVQLPEAINIDDSNYEVSLCQAIIPARFNPPERVGKIRIIAFPDNVHALRHSKGSSEWKPPRNDIRFDPTNVTSYMSENTHVMQSFETPPVEYVKRSYEGVELGPALYVWEYEFPKESIYWDNDKLISALTNIFSGFDYPNGVPNSFLPLLERGKVLSQPSWASVFTLYEHLGQLILQIRDPGICIEIEGIIIHRFGLGMNKNSILRFPSPGSYAIVSTKAIQPPKYGPSILNIYLDIIQPVIVSHTRAPLLKTIAIPENTDILSQEFVSRNYIPVIVESFQTIEVQIRDVTGELAPFMMGIVFLRLHFRRRKV